MSCGHNCEKQLEKALSRHCELMAHVKKAAEEDAARRAEGEHLEEASKEHRLPGCSRRLVGSAVEKGGRRRNVATTTAFFAKLGIFQWRFG